jgi:DNA-binding transcriptional LysR family regulator
MGMAHQPGERRQAVRLHRVGSGQDDCARAVIDTGGVACSDRAAFLLESDGGIGGRRSGCAWSQHGRLRHRRLRHRTGREVEVDSDLRAVFNDQHAITPAVGLGIGYALLPVPHALPHLASGALRRVLPQSHWDDGQPPWPEATRATRHGLKVRKRPLSTTGRISPSSR